MHKFNYSFLSDELLPASLVNLVSNIHALKDVTHIRKEKNENVFLELEASAKILSIKSSNEIEGIVTTDKRILEIVTKNSSPLNHDEADIAGYRDVFNLIYSEYENLNFSQDNILHFHKILMSLTQDKEGGQYKTQDNVVAEIDINGNYSVRFRPVSFKETPFAMEQLELSYLDAISNYKINKLLLIPCVILDFLCIHPFLDGNGRISRLLSLLLLYKNGFDVGKYISFENQINKYKDLYYDALKISSANWHTNQNNYFPFIQNFLTALIICYKELDSRFEKASTKRILKQERIKESILESIVPISKKELALLHPDISVTTIESILSKMLKEGQIEKIGSARNIKYIKVNIK